jgi:hypothetical protein
MQGIVSYINIDEFNEIVKKELLNPEFLTFYENMVLNHDFYDFKVTELYGRGGPSWIALTHKKFSTPVDSKEVLAYYFNKVIFMRKAAIIGYDFYFNLDRDTDLYSIINEAWTDPYTLTVG